MCSDENVLKSDNLPVFGTETRLNQICYLDPDPHYGGPSGSGTQLAKYEETDLDTHYLI